MAARTRLSAPRTAGSKTVTCADCYFRRQGLCALALEETCPTFRAAGSALAPPPQPRLVPRVFATA